MPGIDLGPFLVAGSIMRLTQRFERTFAALARTRGLGPGDLRILLALRRSGSAYALSPTALFRRLMITSGAVSKQVDRLADLGLVERVPDPDILRGVLIKLLPPGRELAAEAMREICSSFGGLEHLSAQDVNVVLDAMSRIHRVLEEADGGATPAKEPRR